MGNEAICQVRYRGESLQARVLLETDRVILRGAISAQLPFAEHRAARAEDGILYLGDYALELGAHAERWQKKILYPPTLADKLGLKVGLSIQAESFEDEELALLPSMSSVGEPLDILLIRVHSKEDLPDIQLVKQRLQVDGALWIIYPKGQKHLTEGEVRNHGLRGGLVDVKTCKFNDQLTGLKFVRRKADR